MRWHKQKQANESTVRRPVRTGINDRSYSYYKAERHTPNQKPIEIHDAKVSKVRLLPSVIAIAVIVLSVLYATTLSNRPSIVFVQDEASAYNSVEAYESYASEAMSKSILSTTKFSVNTVAIEDDILNHFPELDAVSMRLPVLGRKPTIVLSVRNPSVLFSNRTNVYVLDNSGRSVALAKDVNPDHLKGLKTIKDESGLSVEIGKQAVTSTTVAFLDHVTKQLADKNIQIESVTLPQGANLLHIKPTDSSYFIKMDVGGDARLQSGNFLAVREELARQGIAPTEYIDVRVQEKVFYK